MEEWPTFQKDFWVKLRVIIDEQDFKDLIDDDDYNDDNDKPKRKAKNTRSSGDHKDQQMTFLVKYFKENWFNDTWLCTSNLIHCADCRELTPCKAIITDIGLPEGQTRDETWNTNNWIERNFRTVDSIFLGFRCNKRCVHSAELYYPYLTTTNQT